jgi:hypothetical protein
MYAIFQEKQGDTDGQRYVDSKKITFFITQGKFIYVVGQTV